MPNHITNILKFEGSPNAVKRLLESIKGEGDRLISFFRIIPPGPEIVQDLDGYPCNVEDVASWCMGLAPEYDFQRYAMIAPPTDRDSREPIKVKAPHSGFVGSLSDADFELLIRYLRAHRACGVFHIMDFATGEWGTKWDAYAQSFDADGSLRFDTAWAHPKPVMLALSRQHPEVTILAEWADEDTGSNFGRVTYCNGITTPDKTIPEEGTKEARLFSYRVRDFSDEDIAEYEEDYAEG